jgi:hypothetical protein
VPPLLASPAVHDAPPHAVPVTAGAHVPFADPVIAAAHAMQVPAHAVVQQKPSTHSPLAHAAPSVQAAPMAPRAASPDPASWCSVPESRASPSAVDASFALPSACAVASGVPPSEWGLPSGVVAAS